MLLWKGDNHPEPVSEVESLRIVIDTCAAARVLLPYYFGTLLLGGLLVLGAIVSELHFRSSYSPSLHGASTIFFTCRKHRPHTRTKA